jgi:protein-S-isoprenylcysteine O-methyltransferase Ste14
MSLNAIERRMRWIGAVAMLVPLTSIFVGLGRGLRRPKGRSTGRAKQILRLPVYLLIGVPYFGFCFYLWRPLPLTLSARARIMAVLYFPGLAFVVWGRLTLGEMYNVSSGFGAELYADQRLITHGPYAIVRHPMYVGLLIAALGGLLIYRTWTLVFLALNALAVIVFRSRREEETLAIEFGEQWAVYCQQVPACLPHW